MIVGHAGPDPPAHAKTRSHRIRPGEAEAGPCRLTRGTRSRRPDSGATPQHDTSGPRHKTQTAGGPRPDGRTDSDRDGGEDTHESEIAIRTHG